MTRKFLKEIGAEPVSVDLNVKGAVSREKRYRVYEEKNGVYPPDCWALDYTMMCLLYERLLQYVKDASGIVKLDYHKFEFNGKNYTQIELINQMIEIAEFILMNLNNVSKKSKAYKRLVNNKYYVKYGEFNDFNQEQCEVRDRFWKIWAIIFPTMWW